MNNQFDFYHLRRGFPLLKYYRSVCENAEWTRKVVLLWCFEWYFFCASGRTWSYFFRQITGAHKNECISNFENHFEMAITFMHLVDISGWLYCSTLQKTHGKKRNLWCNMSRPKWNTIIDASQFANSLTVTINRASLQEKSSDKHT